MNERNIIELQKSLCVPYISVSDVYPNDDGYLRREAVVRIDNNKTISDLQRLCGAIARAFNGELRGAFCIDGDTMTFIISCDKYVNPPPPWKVVREDPL